MCIWGEGLSRGPGDQKQTAANNDGADMSTLMYMFGNGSARRRSGLKDGALTCVHLTRNMSLVLVSKHAQRWESSRPHVGDETERG